MEDGDKGASLIGSARLRLAEVVGALSHFVEHGADLLPFCVEFFV